MSEKGCELLSIQMLENLQTIAALLTIGQSAIALGTATAILLNQQLGGCCTSLYKQCCQQIRCLYCPWLRQTERGIVNKHSKARHPQHISSRLMVVGLNQHAL